MNKIITWTSTNKIYLIKALFIQNANLTMMESYLHLYWVVQMELSFNLTKYKKSIELINVIG
jgi:hypothetical protein